MEDNKKSKILKGITKSCRFMIIDSKEVLKESIKHNEIIPELSSGLSKILSLTILMAQGIKRDSVKITSILNADGLFGTLRVKTTKNGNVSGNMVVDPKKMEEVNKAILENDIEKLNKMLDIGTGFLNIQTDYGLKLPYTTSIEISNGDLEEAIRKYYLESEQIKTIIKVGVDFGESYDDIYSFGLMIQLLPGSDKTILKKIEEKLKKLVDISVMLKNGFSLEKIAYLIFEDDEKISQNESLYVDKNYDELPMIEDLKILEIKEVEYECDCDLKEMKKMLLLATSKEEIEEMLEKDGQIELVCNFCNKKYVIKDIKELEI